jgi:hypothetical protein
LVDATKILNPGSKSVLGKDAVMVKKYRELNSVCNIVYVLGCMFGRCRQNAEMEILSLSCVWSAERLQRVLFL